MRAAEGPDLLHWMSERVPDGGQFLVAEQGTLGVPDGDLESGKATRPVVVQRVQRGRGSAAGDHHGEGGEAVVAVGFEQVSPPLGVDRRPAARTADLLQILTTVDNGECVTRFVRRNLIQATRCY